MVAQEGSLTDPYEVTQGDTVVIKWEDPTSSIRITHYILYEQVPPDTLTSGMLFIREWLTEPGKRGYPYIMDHELGLFEWFMTANNTAGESGQSNSVFFRVREAVPGPPRIIEVIIRRRQ